MCIWTVQSNTRLLANIWKFNFNKPVESKTQFTKYSINVNCGKQQIYRFSPGLNFNVKYLLPFKKKKQEFNVTMKNKNLMWLCKKKQEFNVTM